MALKAVRDVGILPGVNGTPASLRGGCLLLPIAAYRCLSASLHHLLLIRSSQTNSPKVMRQ